MSDRTSSGHDELALLVPWYVNGSLDAADRARFERHLATCLTCRRLERDERAMAMRLRELDASDLAATAGFERLMRRIDADAGRVAADPEPRDTGASNGASNPAAGAARRGAGGSWLDALRASWRGRAPGWVVAVPTAVSATAIVAAFAFLLARSPVQDPVPESPAPEWRTLSSDSARLDTAADTTMLRVVFDSALPAEDARAVLDGLGATELDERTQQPVWLVTLADADQRDRALAALRSRADVRFAEPGALVAIPDGR